jgi:hypothetical protein
VKRKAKEERRRVARGGKLKGEQVLDHVQEVREWSGEINSVNGTVI